MTIEDSFGKSIDYEDAFAEWALQQTELRIAFEATNSYRWALERYVDAVLTDEALARREIYREEQR